MRLSTGSLSGSWAVILTAACLSFAPAANAQSRSPSAPSTAAPGSPGPAANIPDNKLDAAAAAVKGVSAIRETYEQKVAEAPAPEKDRLANEANGAMEKAVTDQGLSVAEYTSILQTAQNDPALRDRLLERLK